MASQASKPHWLDNYGSKEYQWQSHEQNKRTVYYRPLGLVEYSFDADGRYYEGRADMNSQLDLEVKSSLSFHDLRERILFAWACLRCQHLLLQAKAVPTKRLLGRDSVAGSDICFAVDAPWTVTQAIEDAGEHLVFLYDHFENVDPKDFWMHCQNTGRVVDAHRALAKLFVYRIVQTKDGRSILRFLEVNGHQIVDGLTNYNWMRNFIFFLNQPIVELRKRLEELLEPKGLHERLPFPQEALYPPVPGNRARQRWFWLLTRILRHVRKPLEAGFPNPLRRRTPRTEAISLSPTYAPVLDYSKTPPLNSTTLFTSTNARSTQNLHRLCRQVKCSIGAGCFALAALIMMEMEETRAPNIPLSVRRPFISGFPLDPRAFFNHKNEPNSLMLAFCDGIALPFLPSDLDLDGRLRLLIRQAHRQLAAYQKRTNPKSNIGELQYMGSSRGAGRILANQYLWSMERMDERTPEHLRQGVNPQGAYPMRPNGSMQTCGVSSVGRRDTIIKAGTYDLSDESKDFVADYRGNMASVRPRDNEFLVGIGGTDTELGANVTIDGNAMDPALVEEWRVRFESILDEERDGKMSRL